MSDKLPRMDYRQHRRARRLVHECCNYDEGNCLLLDDGEPCVCVQSISLSLMCRWFRVAVLPLDGELAAALLYRGSRKRCAVCGAAFVPKVKTKVMFNLTKRQLVCFGSGALLGVPLFFLLKGPVGTSTAAMCMVVLMLPFFLLAMYEKNGQPLEKILRNMIRVCFLRPRQRPYKTKNFYAVIMRQNQLDREVYHIVNGKAKTDPRREKAGRSRHRQGEPDR